MQRLMSGSLRRGSRSNRRALRVSHWTRHGFTLMEISLVLFVLVILAALAVPNFQGALERERLRKAAESIAADWTMTRATAMETGETQLWACELGAGNYSASDSTASSSPGADGSGDTLSTLGMTDVASVELTESLPTGYVISQVMSSESNSMTTMAMSSQTTESGRATLFFYPDGTCSNARITVNHEDTPNYSMSVMINGLAGTVRVLPSSTSSGANQ